MNAKITYAMRFVPDPFDKKNENRQSLWCLHEVTTPEYGEPTWKPIAIFNLDSEAERFMGNVFASGMDGILIDIAPNLRDVFLRKRGGV